MNPSTLIARASLPTETSLLGEYGTERRAALSHYYSDRPCPECGAKTWVAIHDGNIPAPPGHYPVIGHYCETCGLDARAKGYPMRSREFILTRRHA